jgi:hypothetical protein
MKVNRRVGGTYRFHLQARISRTGYPREIGEKARNRLAGNLGYTLSHGEQTGTEVHAIISLLIPI